MIAAEMGLGPLLGTGQAAAAILVKVTLVLGVAALVSRMLRERPAATRHLTWFAAVCGSLLVALSEALLPAWHLAMPFLHAPQSPPVLAGAGEATFAPWNWDEAWPGDAGSAASRPSLTVAALGVWAVGAVVLLARVLAGALAASRSVRRSAPLNDPRAARVLAACRRAAGVRQPVRLRRAPPGMTPATWGTFAPAILLPAGAEDWPLERLRIVLMHELAHVVRKDCLTQLLADGIRAALWVHPGMWWACRRLHEERERACDELVVSQGVRPHRYAQILLEVVRGYMVPRGFTAALSMASPSRLERRVRGILEGRAVRGGVSGPRRLHLSVTAMLAVLAVALGIARPGPGDASAGGSNSSGKWGGAVQERGDTARSVNEARLSGCWAEPDWTGPSEVVLRFTGELLEPTWIRLVPYTEPRLGAGRAAVGTADDNLRCWNAPRVGVGLEGGWRASDLADLRYTASARLVVEVPPAPAQDVAVPTTDAPIRCRLHETGGEYFLSCHEDRGS